MERKQDLINRMDILLMLLLVEGPSGTINEPIRGKTRLQKELFLSQKKLKEKGVSKPYPFRPYHYGPYCREIYYDIELLKDEGMVEETTVFTKHVGIVREYKLTSKGIRKTNDMIEKRALGGQYDIIKEVKKKYNSMSVVELVNITHREHPEYVGHKY